jgi:hypothetical protein
MFNDESLILYIINIENLNLIISIEVNSKAKE